jgi:uncharacterized protein (UPF0333 family)
VNKKQHTLYGLLVLIIGTISGIAGTAFTMGAERQRISSALITNEAKITEHKEYTERELDRYTEIIITQIAQLQNSVSILNRTTGDLRTDVQVLKAIMERVEADLRNPD